MRRARAAHTDGQKGAVSGGGNGGSASGGGTAIARRNAATAPAAGAGQPCRAARRIRAKKRPRIAAS